MSDLVGLIIAGILGAIIGFIVGFFSNYLSGRALVNYQRKCEKKDKKKESKEKSLKKHKNELVNVLKEFKNTKIRCDRFNLWRSGDFNFKVEINGLDELKGNKQYDQIIQHFNAYSNIKKNWDNSTNIIVRLNEELKEIKKYLSDKINKEFEIVPNQLDKGIWCVIEHTKILVGIKKSKELDEFLDVVKISLRSRVIYIDSSDGNNLGMIHCKSDYFDKVKDFLYDLFIRDGCFRDKLNGFLNGYRELDTTFDDFKNQLEVLLQDVGDDEDSLQGDCDKCKQWLKEIG